MVTLYFTFCRCFPPPLPPPPPHPSKNSCNCKSKAGPHSLRPYRSHILYRLESERLARLARLDIHILKETKACFCCCCGEGKTTSQGQGIGWTPPLVLDLDPLIVMADRKDSWVETLVHSITTVLTNLTLNFCKNCMRQNVCGTATVNLQRGP